LFPVEAKEKLSAKSHFFRGAIAIAANGTPFLILSRMTAEQSDLANSKPEKVAELEKRLDAYLKSVDDHMPTITPNYKPGSDFGATKRTGGGGKGGSRGRNGGGKNGGTTGGDF
jgi:hypothetical protein